jgi:hypothetical protein
MIELRGVRVIVLVGIPVDLGWVLLSSHRGMLCRSRLQEVKKQGSDVTNYGGLNRVVVQQLFEISSSSQH